MALSCYSNWGELELHLNSEMTIFAQPQQELSPELLSFNPNSAYLDSYSDPIFESHDLFYSENYCSSSLLPCFSSPSDNDCNNLYSLFPEVFPEVEPNPKRQKSFQDCCDNTDIASQGFWNGFVQGPSLAQELICTPAEILSPFPGSFVRNPPVFSSGSDAETTAKKDSNGGTNLSAQSIAARQRRRKITEKTQELGKLIPGGHKMNTAEMFQAAYKYIKFLQAQVGILETLGSFQENGESFQNEELNPLLGSSLIQEKLYSMDKCLVPEKLVQSLGNDCRIQSNTQVLKEFNEIDGIGG